MSRFEHKTSFDGVFSFIKPIDILSETLRRTNILFFKKEEFLIFSKL